MAYKSRTQTVGMGGEVSGLVFGKEGERKREKAIKVFSSDG